MKIGIVTTWFERGASYVSRQYRQLLEDRHAVFIYARSGECYATGDPAWDDASVTWSKRCRLPVLTAIDKADFMAWIAKNSLELVIFNEQSWWLPVLWCKEQGIATCGYVDYYTEQTIPLFSAYDLLFCNTRRHFDTFSWHQGAFYIPWGTDTDLFKPLCIEPVAKDKVTFFHSAGMSPERKGADLVIRAFEKVTGPKKLIIHTQKDLFEAFPDLQKSLQELLASNHLTIVNGTAAAPGYYGLGDVYVYPSRLDGIGLTICEALSCGLPAIVPDNPPMSEFVDGVCGKRVIVEKLYARYDGYYWPQCEISLESLVETMQWYADRYECISACKQSARDFAVEHLNWRSNKDLVLHIVENIKKLDYCSADAAYFYEACRTHKNFYLKLHAKLPKVYFLLESLVTCKKAVAKRMRSFFAGSVI